MPAPDELLREYGRLPWYIKIALYPMVVSAVLLGVQTGYLPSPLTAINVKLATVETTLRDARLEVAALNARLNELERLERVTCRAAARTEWTRLECDR